jgi:hypothetical protein
MIRLAACGPPRFTPPLIRTAGHALTSSRGTEGRGPRLDPAAVAIRSLAQAGQENLPPDGGTFSSDSTATEIEPQRGPTATEIAAERSSGRTAADAAVTLRAGRDVRAVMSKVSPIGPGLDERRQLVAALRAAIEHLEDQVGVLFDGVEALEGGQPDGVVIPFRRRAARR